MRVMTYNIRLGIQHGLEPIAARIREQSPDLLAVQEVGRHWIMGPGGDSPRRLSELSGMEHHVFAPSLSYFPPSQYGHALLSRWPIEAPRVVWLPRGTDEPRTLLTATLRTPRGAVRVVSTHLSHLEDRRLQSPVLLTLAREALADGGPPLLIMGDLNESPDDPWITELQRLHADAGAKDDAPTFPAADPERRIDYLLASKGHWEDVEVIDEASASDHRPLVASWAGWES